MDHEVKVAVVEVNGRGQRRNRNWLLGAGGGSPDAGEALAGVFLPVVEHLRRLRLPPRVEQDGLREGDRQKEAENGELKTFQTAAEKRQQRHLQSVFLVLLFWRENESGF